jgi:hypothetical protein
MSSLFYYLRSLHNFRTGSLITFLKGNFSHLFSFLLPLFFLQLNDLFLTKVCLLTCNSTLQIA